MSVDREYVTKLIRDLNEAIEVILGDASKPFESLSRAERSELRYYIIVLAEALTSLAYHIARRAYGLELQTPIQTLRLLSDRGLVSKEELRDLIALIRLRNLVVHRYWIVDDRRIYESVKRDFTRIRSFVERVRNAFGI